MLSDSDGYSSEAIEYLLLQVIDDEQSFLEILGCDSQKIHASRYFKNITDDHVVAENPIHKREKQVGTDLVMRIQCYAHGKHVIDTVSLTWEPDTQTLLVDNAAVPHCYIESRAVPVGEQDRLYPNQDLFFDREHSSSLRFIVRHPRKHLRQLSSQSASSSGVKKADDATTSESVLENEGTKDADGDLNEMQLKLKQFQDSVKATTAPTKSLKQSLLFPMKTAAATGASGWIDRGSVLIRHTSDVVPSEKIAAFDMDGTIIDTKSGNAYPRDPEDWRLLLSEVPDKMKSLHRDGYKIVIFSNQGGVRKGKVPKDGLIRKFDEVVRQLAVPVQIFISVADDTLRKPRTGMWHLMSTEWNGGISPDLQASFYVGDAAGRQNAALKKSGKDHSCGDLLFAHNLGIQFHVPESFYQRRDGGTFRWPEFNPRSYCITQRSLTVPENALERAGDRKQGPVELIVMVGWPASGKSHFCREHLVPRGYRHISRDVLQAWTRCVDECRRALSAGTSVVVDNTNLEKEARHRYVHTANSLNVPVRCFHMSVSFHHALHNEKFRELTGEKHDVITPIIYNRMKNSYQEPDMSEGFTSIVKVNFIPRFADSSKRRLYEQFLVEK